LKRWRFYDCHVAAAIFGTGMQAHKSKTSPNLGTYRFIAEIEIRYSNVRAPICADYLRNTEKSWRDCQPDVL